MGATSSQEQPLSITIIEGETQSQELFDFTSSSTLSQTSVLTFPSVIALENQKIVHSNIMDQSEKQPIYEFSVGGYREIRFKSLGQEDKNTVWKVIRQSQLLETGDVLKVGKIRLSVKEIVLNRTGPILDRRATQRNDAKTVKSPSVSGSIVSNQEQCRICFEAESTPENPLVNLCKCTGSVRYIHFQCLRDWVSNNITTKEMPNCIQHTYTETQCELCKVGLENQFTHEGRKYTLFSFGDLERVPEPYVRLESRQIDNNKNKVSVYFVRLMDNAELTIGRNNASDVMLRDISVSRAHCSLFFKNKMLFARDKGSKFGTLIKVKKEMQFNNQTGLQLQYQSRLIKINQKITTSNCCCAQTDSYRIVFDQNLDSSLLFAKK